MTFEIKRRSKSFILDLFFLNLILNPQLARSRALSEGSDTFTYQTFNSKGLSQWKIISPTEAKSEHLTGFKDIQVEKHNLTWEELKKTKINFSKLNTIAIVGDSGCRLKESALKKSHQDCSNPKKWKYKQVLDSVIKEQPDLIIHLGDYHYREQCTSGQICKKVGATTGYGWTPWKLDFFEPSKMALMQSPWIMVRGNHEDCQRAYLGYKKFLKSGDWHKDCEDYENIELIELGDLGLINLDSSSLSDMPDISSETEKIWKNRLESIGEKIKASKAKRFWVITHKPVYGLVGFAGAYAPLNINLRKYFESTSWSKKIELILSGHIHNSHVVTTHDFPLQIVVGNGGTTLDRQRKMVGQDNLSALGYEKGRILSNEYGFVILKNLLNLDPLIEFKSALGGLIKSCHLKNKGSDCF